MVAYRDEVLMAYADGELDEETARDVASEIARNEVLRARYMTFARTSRSLGALYAPIMEEPVPRRLIAAVAGPGTGGIAVGRSAIGRLIASNDNWVLAATAAAALVAVVGAAFWLGRVDGSARRADGALLAALESSGSVPVGGENGAGAVARSTFASNEGGYCRQYSVLGEARRDGVACRDGRSGAWVIRAETASTAVVTDSTRPAAGAGSEIDVIVDRLIAGDVLTSDQERDAIGRNWSR